MAEKSKRDPVEEAHWRIDDHERRIGEHAKLLAPENVVAVVNGAMAALSVELDRRMQQHDEELLKLVRQDIETDRAVAQGLKDLIAYLQEYAKKEAEEEKEPENQELVNEIRELVKVLKTPTTRTAVLELPSGPATMTVREGRYDA
jgi:hypothetical protein